MYRSVLKVIKNRRQGEGNGATVYRSIGGPEIRSFDPFLLLDEFHIAPPAGFPDHPHRGIETITFIIEGQVTHEDFCGHKGNIFPGDLQWMTAGKGIVHCEMPGPGPENYGLQLWLNVPNDQRMKTEPSYQELLKSEIPVVEKNGIHASIFSGSVLGVDSPVRNVVPVTYADIKLSKGAKFEQEIPAGWNSFVYIISGKGQFGPDKVDAGEKRTIVFKDDGKSVSAQASTDSELRFVLLAGKPTGEEYVQHGPMVMGTRKEIEDAYEDFFHCRNGFENALDWQSEAVKKMNQ